MPRRLAPLSEAPGHEWRGSHLLLRWGDGLQFVVERSGTAVWCSWPRTLTFGYAACRLLGIALSFVLRLRGAACLHASAVAVGGRAIAFLGPDGVGKSTLAAAFAGRGYPVLTDDLLAFSDRGGTLRAQPGFPYLRLRPPSAEAPVGGAGAALPLTPTKDDQYLDLDLTRSGFHFHRRPLPLAAAYLLGGRRRGPAAPLLEPIGGGQALVALLANTWASHLLEGDLRAREFDQLGRLSRRVPLRRVRSPAGLRHLPALCDAILSDYQALASSPPARDTLDEPHHAPVQRL
jgi:hypothetical protein